MHSYFFLMTKKQKISLILLSWLLISAACYWFLLKPQQATLQQREKENNQLLITIQRHSSQKKPVLNKNKTTLLLPDTLIPFISTTASDNKLIIKQFKPNAKPKTLTLIGSYFSFTHFLKALANYSAQIKITQLQIKREDKQLQIKLNYLLSVPN